MTEASKEELLEITSSLKLTLTETFDRSLRVPIDFKEIEAFHKKEFPNYPLETPQKGTDICLVSFGESDAYKPFFKMLKSALEMTFNTDVVITHKTDWQSAKLVIACEADPKTLSDLKDVPHLILSNLTDYQKEPQQKRAFWKALCQEIVRLKLPKSC
ncbi:MAG: hypothetical protein KDK62_03835 [Chlamydiia bacterium]|nr:hypothetical protein [Chlamydiia bacterium]